MLVFRELINPLSNLLNNFINNLLHSSIDLSVLSDKIASVETARDDLVRHILSALQRSVGSKI